MDAVPPDIALQFIALERKMGRFSNLEKSKLINKLIN